MASTRTLKRRITTAGNIAKITKAMEMVSASKMRRAQEQALASRAYARAIHESLQKVSQLTDPSLHPLLSQHTEGKDVLIIFSTDRGLCGGLNTHLFKSALAWIKSHPDGQIIALGKKAIAFARKSPVTLHAQFTDLPEKIALTDILALSQLITTGFLIKQFRTVSFIYMDFINTLTQKVRMATLLPLANPSDTTTEVSRHDTHINNNRTKLDTVPSNTSLAPSSSNGSSTTSSIAPAGLAQYLFEPTAHDILSELLPYYIEHTLYQTLLEAKASEHSARMVAMKSASDNAKGLGEELRLLYNKSRQASITNELLDITTATLTVSNA